MSKFLGGYGIIRTLANEPGKSCAPIRIALQVTGVFLFGLWEDHVPSQFEISRPYSVAFLCRLKKQKYGRLG